MAISEKSLANIKPAVAGEIRNPNGRPKGSMNVKTIIGKWLSAKQDFKDPVTGKVKKMTQLDIITLAQLDRARSGEVQSYNALLDRYDGKPKQINELTGANGEPLGTSAPQVIIIETVPDNDSLPISESE